MTLSYIEHLEVALRDAPPKAKGQRTRERLKIATARMLELKGYHAMRVQDVTECAQLAEGSFYVYFRDKTDASLAVLTDFLNNFINLEIKRDGQRSSFDSIRLTNRRWVAVCRANSGLMRCILQLGDEEPEFAKLSQNANRIWYERVAEGARRRSQGAGAPALLTAYLLGGMMDELVRKLVIYPDPGLASVLSQLKADDDALADAASLIWFRVFRPTADLPSDLPRAAKALADWMAGLALNA